MFKFKSFITEAKSVAETTAKRTHLEPPGFLSFDGHESVADADSHLRGFSDLLAGKRSNVDGTTKIDGAPAIHVIMDENGQHRVALKALHNKNPKTYGTPEEIDRDYPAEHPLNNILKTSLAHLPKTMPKDMKPGEVYKGDIIGMQGGDRSPKKEKGYITSQPNVIKYKFPADSQEGREFADSKVGVVWHTKFDRKGQATSISPKDRAKFQRSKDVFSFDPSIRVNPQNYTPEEQNAFHNHMENARQEYSKIDPDAYERLQGHNETLRTYMNKAFRNGEQPSFDGYSQHLTDRQKKDVDSVKTDSAKQRKIQQHGAFIQQAHENRKSIEKLINLHNHLENAKKVLVGVADKNSVTANELPNGQPVSHEGYVTVDKKTGTAVKHVGDDVKAFLQSGMGTVAQSRAARQQVTEDVNEPVSTSDSVVSHYGKWRIPHRGYNEVVKKVANVAKKTGSDSEIALSGASNPIPYESKVGHARKMFPGANITSTQHKNYLEHAADLNRRGYKTLHVVVGSDRAEEFKNTLERYNGRPDKSGRTLFHFPGGIHVHVAGKEREEGSTGVTGSSSTNQERYARAGDYNSFAKNAPAEAKPEHVKAMYDEVRSNLKEESGKVPMEADAPSVAELSARGSMESGPKKKKIKEETGSGSVGGLGFNTGNPAATDDHIANYVDTNTADADTRDNVLKGMINKSGSKTSDKIGFKAFDPKQKGRK